jgi:hypothetical protein
MATPLGVESAIGSGPESIETARPHRLTVDARDRHFCARRATLCRYEYRKVMLELVAV